MDLQGIMLHEISQTERQILYDFTYMWYLKYKRNNKHNKIKQIYRYTEHTGGCQRERTGDKKEIGEGD